MGNAAEYISTEEIHAIVDEMNARRAAARLKRFTGKRERTFTIEVLTCDVLGGYKRQTVKIKGFTLADAKEQAAIK